MPSIADVIVRTRLEGDALDRLPAQLRRIPDRYTINVRADDNASRPLREVGTAADRAARDTRALAQEQIRTATAARDFGAAQAIVQRELQRTDNTLLQQQRLLTQQTRLQERAAAAARQSSRGLGPTLPRSVEFFGEGAIDQIKGVAAGLGGVAAAMQAVNLAIGAGKAGLALRQQENTVRALAGSTEEYNRIVATARQQQDLWGGTLQENIAGLQGLVVSSRSSGAALSQLIDLAQRLAVLDPAQGAEGARVALSEAVAGDPTSLARRYEIPRSALEKIKDESISTSDRLQVLDDYLTKIGITGAAVAGSIDDTTRAYNGLSTAVDSVRTGAGADIADVFAPLARGLSTLLTSGQGVRAELQAQASAAAAASTTYDDYKTNIQRVIDANSGLAFSVTPLTEAQFAAAQALTATGLSAEEAATKLTMLGNLSALIENFRESDAVLSSTSALMLQLATSSPAAAVSIQALAEQYVNGNLTGEQFVAQLQQMEGWLQAQAAASAEAAHRAGEHSIAVQEASAAITEATEKAALDEAQTRLNTQAKDQLAASAQAAAQELLNSGNASLAARTAMAAQYGVALNLVDAYYQIAQAARAAAIAQAGAAAIAQNIYDDAGNVMAGRGSRKPPGAGGEVAARLKALREIEAAQQAAVLSTGTYTQKIAALTKERDRFVKGSAEWIKANTAIVALQQSAAKSGAKTATKAPTHQAREAERLQQPRDALLSDEEKLATLRQRVASGKLSELDRLEAMKEIKDLEEKISRARETADAKTLAEADKLKKAREALLSDEELLAQRRAEVESGKLPEIERLEAVKEIRDLEKKIADERLRAEEAAVDAALGRVNDAQKRLEEDRRIAAAQAILKSKSSTDDQRKAAELALQEVELERKKRALDIAENDREAGGVSAGVAGSGATFTNGRPVAPMLALDATPAQPVPVEVATTQASGGDGFAAAVRQALDGATLLLQGSDGRLTPAILSVAAQRYQAGKR